MLALRCELSVLRRTHAEAMAAAANAAVDTLSSRGNGTIRVAKQADPTSSEQDSEDEDTEESQMDRSAADHAEPPCKESQFVNGPSVGPGESASPDNSHPAELVLDNPLMLTNGHGEDSSVLTTDSFDSGLPCPSHSDLCTLPRRRISRSQSTTAKTNVIPFDSLHQLKSDLAVCREREADARSALLDLKTRYHEMEELQHLFWFAKEDDILVPFLACCRRQLTTSVVVPLA
ncbi:unnamed protein product [Echinostoma caproni]|uniref:EB1 C-terminal domain-containing protein n=1 Tax=Echinostoma caproni TaxID=27848 RepID=A0A183AN96_9TREM|nr:unnamed protein product [Echinostoma caproni]